MAENAGLYQKFNVSRRDGRDQPGGDRQDAVYFVLDISHDPFALDALRAYRMVCEGRCPELAKELWALEQELRSGVKPGSLLKKLAIPKESEPMPTCHTTQTLSVSAACPSDGTRTLYEVKVYVGEQFILAEDMVQKVEEVAAQPRHQEELTQLLANLFKCPVKTSGQHARGRVAIACYCTPEATK